MLLRIQLHRNIADNVSIHKRKHTILHYKAESSMFDTKTIIYEYK